MFVRVVVVAIGVYRRLDRCSRHREPTAPGHHRPGYGVWDAFASQRVLRGVSLFAALDNIADAQDPNLGNISASGTPLAIYRPDVGRTVRFGMRWAWAK